jgi:hypothetical protein
MFTINSVVEILKKWSEQEKLIEKTIDGFWKCFSNYKEELPEEYRIYFKENDDTLISLVKPSIALVVSDSNDDVFCSVNFIIEYNGKTKAIYKKFFALDGESFDDEFYW